VTRKENKDKKGQDKQSKFGIYTKKSSHLFYDRMEYKTQSQNKKNQAKDAPN